MIDVEIDMKDLLKRLKTLPEKMQKRIITGGVRASAKPIIQDARSRIHSRTGILAKSIGVTKRRSKNKNIIVYTVSPRVKDVPEELEAGRGTLEYKKAAGGYYGRWVELGHFARKSKKEDDEKKKDKKKKDKKEEVKFIPAKPFLKPAFETKGEEAIKAFKEYVKKRFDKLDRESNK